VKRKFVQDKGNKRVRIEEGGKKKPYLSSCELEFLSSQPKLLSH